MSFVAQNAQTCSRAADDDDDCECARKNNQSSSSNQFVSHVPLVIVLSCTVQTISLHNPDGVESVTIVHIAVH